MAYEKLEIAINEGAPFRQAWTKTNWYKTVRAKAKELNAINHMLMEDTADESINSNEESSTEQFMPLAINDFEEVAASSSSSSSSSVESYTTTIHDEGYNSSPSPLEITSEDTEAANIRKKRVSAADSDILKKKRNAMRELKRLADNKQAKMQKSDRSNVFPFTSTSTERSPDQLYHSDDESLKASADKLRG